MTMVEQFGIWPVDGGLYAQDPDFIADLRLARMARDDHNLFAIAEPDKDTKQVQARRRAELARWRREQNSGV